MWGFEGKGPWDPGIDAALVASQELLWSGKMSQEPWVTWEGHQPLLTFPNL